MDLSDPDVWRQGLRVVVDAPHVVVPLMIIVAGAAWWLRGALMGAKLEGADAARVAAEQRLALAREREADAEGKREETKRAFEDLKAQIAAGAPPQLTAATERVQGALR